MERLFTRHVRKSPQHYDRDIRLDRARGFVTQTEMPLSEVAMFRGRCRSSFAVNVTGTFLASRHALPLPPGKAGAPE